MKLTVPSRATGMSYTSALLKCQHLFKLDLESPCPFKWRYYLRFFKWIMGRDVRDLYIRLLLAEARRQAIPSLALHFQHGQERSTT